MRSNGSLPARQARVGHLVAGAVLLGLALAIGVAFQRALARAKDPARPPAARVAVDLATDPAWRLGLLPGIGPSRAQAIVSRRLRDEGTGGAGLRTAEDLLAVPGIGPGSVRRLMADDLPVRVLLAGRPLRWARE